MLTPVTTLGVLRDDGILRRVVANGAWLVGATGIAACLGALQGVVIARTLGVAGFGTVGLVVAFVNVFGRLTSFRMHEFVIQYVSRYEAGDQSSRAAAIKFAVGVEVTAAVLAYVVLWLAAPLGARWFVQNPDATLFIRLYGVVVLAGLVSETSQGILQLYERYPRYSAASTFGAAAAFGGVVAAAILGHGVIGVLAGLVAGSVLTSCILATSAFVEVRRRLGRRWWTARLDALRARWRSVLVFVSSTNISSTLSMIAKDGDVLWLGLFRSPTEAGFFRLAYSLAGLVFLPLGSLVQSIYPELARQAAHRQWTELRRLARRATRLAATYVVPSAIIVAALSLPLIGFVYGREFVPAAPALFILLAGMGFANVFFWARPALLALHRPDFQTRVAFALVVIKLVGVFTLVPLTGYVGSAVLAAAIYVPGAAILVWKVRHLVAQAEWRKAAA